MKKYQKLDRFPLGSILAEGFLKDQMKIGKNGISGRLHEIEPDMVANPFVNKTHVPAWGNSFQSGWGAEISGNYWFGYIMFAYTLNDPEMIETATNWVNAVLKNQKEDGYLGTYFEDDAPIYEDFNAWGTSRGMMALLAYYEATGREDVLNAVYRCMLWFCDKWAGEQKTNYAGISIVETMILTYNHIRDQRLVDFCEDFLEYVCRNDLYKLSYKTMLSDEFFYLSYHSATIGSKARLPALTYTATGKQIYLDASEKFIRKNRDNCIQLHGGAVSATEYNGPKGAVRESEYCTFTTLLQAYSYLSYITGDPKYGDYMEEIFYNGAQGARKKDETAIAYYTAPNQVLATEYSSGVTSDTQVYAPCYPVSCCPVNAVVIVPDFVRSMLLHDEDDNVYVTAYGPCVLNYKDISIREQTSYPFRNHVCFEINCCKEFSLNLKIPQWCTGYEISLNDTKIDPTTVKDGYAQIHRKWSEGDTISIRFEAKVEVIKVDDSAGSGKYPLAVKYGALLYSYHIPEKWVPIKGKPMSPLPEGFSWYNVKPEYEEADVPDPHEKLVMRRQQYSWNFAIDENIKPEDFTVEEVDTDGYVWENPMIRLHTHCYKAPYLTALYETKTFEPIGQYQYVTHKIPLTLVPYGCTNLRITYFPKADLKK